MRFLTIAATLLGVTAISSATALGPSLAPRINTDADGYLMACLGKNYGIACVNLEYTNHDCQNLPSDWRGKVHTVAPVLTTGICTVYRQLCGPGMDLSASTALAWSNPPADPGAGPWQSFRCVNQAGANNPRDSAPTNTDTATALTRRINIDADGYLMACLGANYGITCVNLEYTNLVCQNFPSDWHGQVHTIAPVLGGGLCVTNRQLCGPDMDLSQSTVHYWSNPPADPGAGPWQSFRCTDQAWLDNPHRRADSVLDSETELMVHPIMATSTDLEKRDPDGYVVICNNPLYNRDCINQGYVNGHCYTLPDYWNGELHTVAPVRGGLNATCSAYRGVHCDGQHYAWIDWQNPPVDPGVGPYRSIQCYDGAWNNCNGPQQSSACGTERRSIDDAEPAAVAESMVKRNALLPSNIPLAGDIDGYFYECTLPGFTGDCFMAEYSSKECHNLVGGFRYVQAATPLEGTHADCIFYRDTDCKGEQTHAISRPIDNFAAAGIYGPFGSWSCDCGTACPKKSQSAGLVDVTTSRKRDASAVSIFPTPSLHKRDKPLHPKMHIYICSEPNWKGICYNYEADAGQCLNPPFPFHGILVGSAGPDKGIVCALFTITACQGGREQNTGPMRFPGYADISVVDRGRVFFSFKCVPDV